MGITVIWMDDAVLMIRTENYPDIYLLNDIYIDYVAIVNLYGQIWFGWTDV